MITVNNDPRIACPNANWNGVTTNYCSGVTSDDVVAHEWGHAYTEYTSGLIYQWQPGALNEAYSDIWGKTVDFLNTREHDRARRTAAHAGHCSRTRAAPIELTITAPAASPAPARRRRPPSARSITETAVDATGDIEVGPDAANDGATRRTTDGCSPFNNAAGHQRQVGLRRPRHLPFTDKVDNAEDAGATGIVIGQLGGPALRHQSPATPTSTA